MKLLTTAILIFAGLINGQNIDLIWKAKALQSLEKVDSLTKIKKPNKKQVFEMGLESAFMNIANPELKNIVVKKQNGILTFHLLLKMETDEVLDIAFQYDIKTENYIGVRVDKLPKGWGIRPDMPGNLEHYMMITNLFDNKTPGFAFNKKNPFEYQVFE